jgi:hypothetical protein
MQIIEYTVTEPHGADGQCCGTLADLILDAHMIPRCGLIPPFRVVATIIRSGGSRGGMSPGCTWPPFDLTEDEYLRAIGSLESLTPDELRGRHRDPHMVGELQPDYSAPDTDSYQTWIASLVQRGHLPGSPFQEASR